MEDVLVKLNPGFPRQSCIQQEESSFYLHIGLKLRKKLVKCYIWSIALYGAEAWTLRAVDQKHLESFKCGVGEGWRRSVGSIM